MDYQPLGRTGVRVSPLCLGCMMFGGKTGPEDSFAIIDRAIDAGINFLDTANVYSRGRSEEVTGEALRRNGKRDRIVLATKVHGVMDDADPNGRGNSRRHIIAQCEASLRRLQTDWIDLYQIHRPQSDIPLDETLRALDDLIRAGKVRYAGTTTFAAWQIVESLWISKELGLHRFVCDQPPYNIFDRRIERELLPMARTHGMGIIPWSPIAGGLLSGKYRPDAPLPAGARFPDPKHPPHVARRLSAPSLTLIPRLEALARARGVPLAQFALAWVRHQPGVTSPIIGPRTMEQFEDNLSALDLAITADDARAVDEIVPPGSCVAPFYEADFGPHQYSWP